MAKRRKCLIPRKKLDRFFTKKGPFFSVKFRELGQALAWGHQSDGERRPIRGPTVRDLGLAETSQGAPHGGEKSPSLERADQ